MPQRHIPFWSVVGLLIVSFCAIADAAQVSHHGHTVESRGTVRDCLSCHDGTTAKNISPCTVRCTANTQHSVLKSYPTAGGREKGLRSLAQVRQRGIRIVNGMVTCISCHNLENQAKYHLAVGNESSRLCLSCHLN